MARMQGNKGEPERKPQTERKHPDEWQQDLSPDHMAGQNISPFSEQQEQELRTAHDIKGLHRGRLKDFNDTDLKQIPVLAPGTRLAQGATYIDLNEGAVPREFTATGEMTAGAEHCYVPKNQVPYEIWNRLIGEPKPGQA